MVPLWAAGFPSTRQTPEVVTHVCNHSALSAGRWEAEMGGITGEPWARQPAVQTTAETTPETLHHQGSRGELTPETRSLAIMCP